jgi:hypothetical protein
MKPDHRPGPYLPLKGLDYIGFVCWSGFLISGMWVFCYGEHYEWWRGQRIWAVSALCVAFFILGWCRSHFHEKPYLDLKIFGFSAVWKVIFWLFAASILQSAPRLLQSIYLNAVLEYDSLNVISLNYPILYGIVLGALFSFYCRVKWHWNVKQYMVFAFGMLVYYIVAMYFLIDGETNKEAFYLPLVAVGVSEVMIGIMSNVFISQSVPFSYFFPGLCAIGFSRCGIGNVAGAAIVQRLYNWASVKNSVYASDNIDGTLLPFDMPSWSETLTEVSRQTVMLTLKECYGYLAIFGVICILFIMMMTYRNNVTRLIPRMASIRKWLNNPVTGDPSGSVLNKESD